MNKRLKKNWREAGIILIMLIFVWAWLTRTDQFWAGRAAFFSFLVLFGIMIVDQFLGKKIKKKD
ncbi:MAG: hypothetical protein GOU99_01840 [Candidatus Altiarchaeota archaeon]|nr:hypothetical protein [Candidatus Altiarchaeota archaeon]